MITGEKIGLRPPGVSGSYPGNYFSLRMQELKILEVEVVEGGVECWAALCSLEALRVSSSQVLYFT
jgi:hypothetical protein